MPPLGVHVHGNSEPNTRCCTTGNLPSTCVTGYSTESHIVEAAATSSMKPKSFPPPPTPPPLSTHALRARDTRAALHPPAEAQGNTDRGGRGRGTMAGNARTSPRYIFFRPSFTADQDLRSLMLFSIGECSPKGAPDLTSLMNRMQDRYLVTHRAKRASTAHQPTLPSFPPFPTLSCT